MSCGVLTLVSYAPSGLVVQVFTQDYQVYLIDADTCIYSW